MRVILRLAGARATAAGAAGAGAVTTIRTPFGARTLNRVTRAPPAVSRPRMRTSGNGFSTRGFLREAPSTAPRLGTGVGSGVATNVRRGRRGRCHRRNAGWASPWGRGGGARRGGDPRGRRADHVVRRSGRTSVEDDVDELVHVVGDEPVGRGVVADLVAAVERGGRGAAPPHRTWPRRRSAATRRRSRSASGRPGRCRRRTAPDRRRRPATAAPAPWAQRSSTTTAQASTSRRAIRARPH